MGESREWRLLTEEARGKQEQLDRWHWIIMQPHERYLQRWIEQKQHELSALIAASTTDAILLEHSQKQRLDLLYDLTFRSTHLMHVHQLSRLREIHMRMQALWRPEPQRSRNREVLNPQTLRFVQLWGQRFEHEPREEIIVQL